MTILDIITRKIITQLSQDSALKITVSGYVGTTIIIRTPLGPHQSDDYGMAFVGCVRVRNDDTHCTIEYSSHWIGGPTYINLGDPNYMQQIYQLIDQCIESRKSYNSRIGI